MAGFTLGFFRKAAKVGLFTVEMRKHPPRGILLVMFSFRIIFLNVYKKLKLVCVT